MFNNERVQKKKKIECCIALGTFCSMWFFHHKCIKWLFQSVYWAASPEKVVTGLCEFFVKDVLPAPYFFAMAGFSEQCTAMKFCFLHGKNAVETIVMLQIATRMLLLKKLISSFCVSKRWKYQLMKNFVVDIFQLPNGWKCQKICMIVLEDQQCFIEEIEELPGVTWSSSQQILLEFRKAVATY